MIFLKLAFKNLMRHKIRSLLTAVGIILAIAVLFSILSFTNGFKKGLDRELQRTGIHFMILPAGCPYEAVTLILHGLAVPEVLDKGVIEQVKTIKGIESASPILIAQLFNPRMDKFDLVYGLDMSDVFKLKPEWEIDGSLPEGMDEILIGSIVAKSYRLRPGDEITYGLENKRFKVTGILKETVTQDDSFVYMPIETLQGIINKPGITAIGVRVKDPIMLNNVISDINIKVPGVQTVTMGKIMDSISSLASSARSFSLSIAIIIILISAIGIATLMLNTVFERTQEIGMMRAIGASRSDIFRIVINESAVIALIGGLAGIFLSIFVSPLIEKIIRAITPYVPEGRMITFEQDIALLCLIFSIVIGVTAGLYPAWKASCLSPVEAMGA
jgi:putative ABC transport system permease protein